MNLIQKKWKISFRIICQCFSTVPFESLYKVDHHTKKAQTRSKQNICHSQSTIRKPRVKKAIT